jgi:hypothetical protein
MMSRSLFFLVALLAVTHTLAQNDTSVIDTVKDKAGDAVETVKDFASDAGDKISDVAGNVKNSTLEFASDAGDKISAAAGTVKDWTKETWSSAKNWATGLWCKGKSAWENFDIEFCANATTEIPCPNGCAKQFDNVSQPPSRPPSAARYRNQDETVPPRSRLALAPPLPLFSFRSWAAPAPRSGCQMCPKIPRTPCECPVSVLPSLCWSTTFLLFLSFHHPCSYLVTRFTLIEVPNCSSTIRALPF